MTEGPNTPDEINRAVADLKSRLGRNRQSYVESSLSLIRGTFPDVCADTLRLHEAMTRDYLMEDYRAEASGFIAAYITEAVWDSEQIGESDLYTKLAKKYSTSNHGSKEENEAREGLIFCFNSAFDLWDELKTL